MVQVDLSDYKTLYLQTAKEYINKMLISLNQLSNDVLNKEALNNLHIASHSLRSQSQVMRFTEIANICLDIEKVSNNALKGIIQLNDEIISDIKKGVERLDGILRFTQDNIGIKS